MGLLQVNSSLLENLLLNLFLPVTINIKKEFTNFTQKKPDRQWTRDGFGLGDTRALIGYSRYRLVGSDDESNVYDDCHNDDCDNDSHDDGELIFANSAVIRLFH